MANPVDAERRQNLLQPTEYACDGKTSCNVVWCTTVCSEMNLINGDKEQTDSCRPIYDARGENLIRYRDLSFRKNEKLTNVFGLDPTQCVERWFNSICCNGSHPFIFIRRSINILFLSSSWNLICSELGYFLTQFNLNRFGQAHMDMDTDILLGDLN